MADPELSAKATVQGWLKEHAGGSLGDREAVRLLQELSPEKVKKAITLRSWIIMIIDYLI